MLLKRADVRKPTLPEEVVPVPELGGDVMVRGLGLAARMALAARFGDENDPASKHFGHLAPLLECTVLADDELPIFTAQDWEIWGATNRAAFMRLWDIAWRLSDLDGKEAAKNSTAPTSE